MFRFQWRELDFSHKYDESPLSLKDTEFEQHYHNFYEIYCLFAGNVNFTVENEKRSLHSGDVVLIKPGEFHNVEFRDNAPYERYVLKLSKDFIPAYLLEKVHKHVTFFPKQKQTKGLFRRFDRFVEMYKEEDLFYSSTCATTEILIYLCHFDETLLRNDETRKNKMFPILQYINTNITKPIKLEMLAQEFHYSQSYISHEFFEYMKIPIMKYIRTKRILAAQQIIRQGIKPTVAAEYLGFSDYSTFYRSYVAVIGEAPSKSTAQKNNTVFLQ